MAKKCPKCQSDNPETATFCSDCGTQLPSSEDKEVTETLETPKTELTRGATLANRYEIIEELGKGGMGRVYRVEDKKLEQEIALKLIKPEIAKNKKTIDRFRNELKLARNIRHKNVCGMFDLGETKGAHFITMEYVRGEDLGSLIRRIGQLPLGKSISITKQICEGLAEAHRLGVVHRDLKSNNIMIDNEGNVRIMDFGIARSIEAKSITGAGMIIGTPEYMSPEQVEGEEVDHRSDIYSLGVILYEMVTGRVPFVGNTPFSIGVKHKSEVPQDPKELNAQIPNDLNQVILKCLEKDREKRYQKVAQLFPDLAQVGNRIPTTDKTLLKGRPKTLGERKKGWKKPLVYGFASILILSIISVGIFLLFPRKEAFNSIAVLPFAYEQDNPNMEYLSDGITDSLINKLSQLPNFTVISRFSVFHYKNKDPNPQEVGTKLKVKAVLLGKIADRSDGLSVVAELVDASDNSVIWGEQYNRKKLEDIFSIQENISTEITEKLRLHLRGEEKKRLTKRPTENADAYKAYLKGRFFWNKRSKEGVLTGLDYFEEAIGKDPAYALAYAGLADSYNILSRYSYITPDEAMPKAKAAALKALEIDDTLGEAYTSLGFIRRYYDWDWLDAERNYRRAIEFNPSYGTAHHWLALLLSSLERHKEAISEIKRAQELDPLSLIINTNVAWVYYFARQYDRAEEQFKKTLDMEPTFGVAHQRLGRTYLQKGMFEAAIKEFQKGVSLIPESTDMLTALGHGYAMMGEKGEALKILDQLREHSKNQYVSSYDVATIYTALGETESAFDWLNRAYKERSSYLAWIKVDPRLDDLRADPRFKKLLMDMNLE